MKRASIAVVVQQHLEDATVLRGTRAVLVRAPHVKLHQLRRLDDRIAAHLDGLATAGPDGLALIQSSLESPGAGTLFTATVIALESRDPALLERCLAIAEAEPDSLRGVLSAFGWVSAASLRGITKALLDAPSPLRRGVGLLACAMHQVSPGPALDAALDDPDAALRPRALAVAGRLGRRELLPACLRALADGDAAVRHAAACAALLLGDRGQAAETLRQAAGTAGPGQADAVTHLIRSLDEAGARTMLQALSRDKDAPRLLIRAIGAAGDAHYVPWLIKQMEDLALSRLAGESFSLITGLDLALLDLERKPPEANEAGPNDDPADPRVAMDEDDGLPWPDPQRIADWWAAQGAAFAPGRRFFMGAVPTPAHCLAVLASGFQRQRTAAAEALCLLQPGTPQFNTAAPAWRQQRLLQAAPA